MDLIRDDVRHIYFKYFSAAFGGAMIGSIYSFVDMIVVGQYHGPLGAAALAVFAPIWNILYSLGLLFGIGGAVIFSVVRGQRHDSDKENGFFTVSLLASAVIGTAIWVLFWVSDTEILKIFGADTELLPLCVRYLQPIKFVIPAYIFTQLLSAFLRNDNDPVRVTAAVLAGGGFNIFGDVFFVFGLDMGIFGAGLATAAGNLITLTLLGTHFFTKKNTLRIVSVKRFGHKLSTIVRTGFSTFFVDVAMGIVTMLLNHQILKYLGTDALAVYGIIINISTCVQCCAYSVGQAAQPVISMNFGAGKYGRIKKVLGCALITCAAFSLLWTVVAEAFPLPIVHIFMQPSETVTSIAPPILRGYALSFILLPLNVFSTYYFQALMRPVQSFVVSVARGLVVSGLLILLLPVLFPPAVIWYAMPVTELAVAVYAIYNIRKFTKNLVRE